MKNKLITTTVLTMAVFLAGVFIVQAQTSVDIEAEQRTEVRSDGETDDADDELAQEEANYNNSRSNRSTASDDGDVDGDGYGDVQRSDQADTQVDAQANSTTSADIDANDADDDGDGLPDGESDSRGVGVTKELDKASPKLFESLSIDEDSPLRNTGVEIGVRGDVCTADEDCDDDDPATPPGKADVSIRVSGDDVRGWSDEQKEAVRSRLEAASEMNTANDFGLQVASAALDNDNVVDIASDKDKTEIRYKTRLNLFGFIPLETIATARAEANGGVQFDYPWYGFLAQKDDDSIISQLVANLRAGHDVMISVEEEGVEVNYSEEEN